VVGACTLSPYADFATWLAIPASEMLGDGCLIGPDHVCADATKGATRGAVLLHVLRV
jgi:hypothetical protein